ncbi:MAG: glycosyltransferase family 2 protein [Acidimicrobiales bacterium]
MRETSLSCIGLVVTAVATLGALRAIIVQVRGGGSLWAAAAFTALVGGLMWGGVAFQVARLGFHWRRRQSIEEPDRARMFDGVERGLLVLVPSYREEPEVVAQTVASAALLAYPGKRVVLLIDDPPEPGTTEQAVQLGKARALPELLIEWFEPAGRQAKAAYERFTELRTDSAVSTADEVSLVAGALERAAEWFDDRAAEESTSIHGDALFRQLVLAEPAIKLREEATELRQRFQHDLISRVELEWRMRRLVARFDTEIEMFERKRYVNLSQQPNKASNLNSYLGLLGGMWHEVERGDGLYLEADEGSSGRRIPEPEFVMTLDADSVVADDYAEKLISYAHRPGNDRVGVFQTPYSAVPGAPTTIERIAGATTDIQYNIHQGFGAYEAEFWVGANAIIRTTALRDLEEPFTDAGHTLKRFVSDRTVIEDTESSLELALAGWRIHNHPERLSFSATPPDFGSLVVQRRRWANGGLILTDRLRDLVANRRAGPVAAMLRGHYLLSIACTNVALAILLYTSIGVDYASWWLAASAVPYFALYARDLSQVGYRGTDIGRVYALNLLLVPTNLAGVAASVRQLITRNRTAFARTPKIGTRTSAPAWLHLAALAMVAAAAYAAVGDLAASHYAHAMFAATNALILIYAITTFIGWTNLAEDLVNAVMPPARSSGRPPNERSGESRPHRPAIDLPDRQPQPVPAR